ncbi:superoxide dismutase [Cavenderia fasciculata]|uniref:superoxide dismutase n=1 Tax=Cavenderia fasciculata TaxID=261658 RepID=F4Q8I3_CACFS|nr:superoxide dismutase [Cavenderia fasciculata]EGG16083.1 superoxide dismutase [Cavenderia fasciculata]|eukprot:XP_004352408.1 superoxide dismutase [Cavenderia fasciculata]
MFSSFTRSTVSKLVNGSGASALINARTYYRMPSVPYAQKGLKPFLSERSISFHLEHHKTDIEKANNLVDQTPYRDLPITQVLRQAGGDSEEAPFFNLASSHFNQSFFWKSITDRITEPSVFMLKAFRMDFGSFEEFKAKFSRNASSMSMPGYTWLVFRDKSLSIINTFGSGSPYELEGAFPLLCLDLHERAYYLDYQTNKKKYIANFWNFVDWEFVENKFLNALVQDKDHKQSIEQALVEEYEREMYAFDRDQQSEKDAYIENAKKQTEQALANKDDIDFDDDLEQQLDKEELDGRFAVEEETSEDLYSEDDFQIKK